MIIVALLLIGIPFWAPEAEGRMPFKRNAAAVRAFRKTNPCPATGKTTGACKGWVVDHVVALGCSSIIEVDKRFLDVPRNMQWQATAAAKAKDRWERQPEACQTLWSIRRDLILREDVH